MPRAGTRWAHRFKGWRRIIDLQAIRHTGLSAGHDIQFQTAHDAQQGIYGNRHIRFGGGGIALRVNQSRFNGEDLNQRTFTALPLLFGEFQEFSGDIRLVFEEFGILTSRRHIVPGIAHLFFNQIAGIGQTAAGR